MTSSDAVIIGGGAAGCSTAFHLAYKGHKVTLLEKHSGFPLRSCGGGMAASVQQLFPFPLKSAVDEVIKRVEFSWCLSDKVIADLPGDSPFWITRREKLDELLLNNAIEKGTDFFDSFEVKTIDKNDNQWRVTSVDGRAVEGKCLENADGSNSPWAEKFNLGPKKLHYASTTSVRLKGRGLLPPITSRFEFGLVQYGFAWAFPLEDSVNIGVGTFIGNKFSDSKEILNQLLPSLGFEQDAGIRKDSQLRVWNGHNTLHREGLVVVGDAASLCDPFLAEGLRPSLISGHEAAKSIHHWLTGNTNDLSNYTLSMKEKWGNSMAWGRRISQVFYRFPKIGYNLGIKRPTAPQRIAQILSGEMGYENIAQRVIKRLLFQR